jgi:hypothetical protein
VRPHLAKNWPLAAVAAMGVAAAEAGAGAAEVAVEVEVLGAVVSILPAPAGEVHAAPADAAASSLEVVSAALPAEAAEVVLHPAGYGRQLGAGFTAAGVALHHRRSHLVSHRSKSRRMWPPTNV